MRFYKSVALLLLLSVGFGPTILQSQKTKKKQKKEEPREIRLLKKEIKMLKLKRQRLQLLNSIEGEKLKKKLARLKAGTELLRQENLRKRELRLRESDDIRERRNRISYEMAKMNLLKAKMGLKKARYQRDLARLRIDIEKRKKKQIWESRVNRVIRYARQPFTRGRLVISDRRISLNGIIYYDMADRIVEKIHFYNNKSAVYPIFIVIDSSPGGSVMAGYRILMAMKASKAPVHVVVKSLAASMAAVIAAHAKHSYAYPGAIILHHQVSSFNYGNVRQQKEKLRMTREWMRRILTPVARKMGITLKRFVGKMYKHNSNGNWSEFGDRAVGLKWIDNLVHSVREDSILEMKKEKPRRRRFRIILEKKDRQGRRYVELPRIVPQDVYYLNNPDGYYRYPP